MNRLKVLDALADVVTVSVTTRRLPQKARTEMNLKNYAIAVVDANGEFEIIERIRASSDVQAEAYAARLHAGIDWYVLDADGNNINA